MSALEYTIYGIRRGWRISKDFLFVGMFAAAVVGGVFSNLADTPFQKITACALFCLWAVVFGLGAHQRYGAESRREISKGRIDLALGLMLVVATHAVVQIAGGLGSVFYPLVFVLVAFLVVYTAGWVAVSVALSAVVLELSVVHFQPTQEPWSTALAHAVFIAFFALINLVFTRTEVARLRRNAKHKLEAAEAELASDARDFRLTAAAMGNTGVISRAEESAKFSRSAVGEVRRAMYHHVDLLKRTMALNSCLILWLDARGEKLRILECVTEADNVVGSRLDRRKGAIGATLQSGGPLCLKGLKPGYTGLSYYENPVAVTDFVGVPIIEDDNLRGLVCADRCGDQPFTKVDVENLSSAIESILRMVGNERVMTQLQKAKSEQGKLLAASDALSRALSENQVMDAAVEAAGRITQFDLAAIAVADAKGRQVVHTAAGTSAEAIVGQSIATGTSLAAAALKNKHYLPYKGDFDPSAQTLFNARVQKNFKSMRSALVLPLVVGDESIGTLTLVSAEARKFGEDVRTTLQVMTNQLSAALLNARMVHRLEEMATTDGLTGLANRRMFSEEIERKMASAVRFNKNLSVILCDIDKFKGVNDTYGHGVGDEVLKGFGRTLKEIVVRDTDLPARYGGEEFVILCEGTDQDGAVQLAERIRRELESQTFSTEQGPLQVTISMGVATYPRHARTKDELVTRADEALYTAKDNGRNQVRIWAGGTPGTA